MSSSDVMVINTKLDILIEDLKSFKQYTIGFVIAIVVPLSVYILLQLIGAEKEIALMHQQIETSSKAIKDEKVQQ